MAVRTQRPSRDGLKILDAPNSDFWSLISGLWPLISVYNPNMQSEDFEALHELESEFWWFAGMREITAALLDPLLANSTDLKILDAGCGTGGNLKWLERYADGQSVVGIDLVTDALTFCHAKGSWPLAQASVTHLPFADASFDLVTSFDVLVQMPENRHVETALREMFRVLRPGGKVFIRVAAYQWMYSSHDQTLATQRRYGLNSIRKKIEMTGFQIIRRTYANSVLLPAAIFNRLVLKRLGLTDKGSDVKPWSPHFKWLNHPFTLALNAEASWLARNDSSLPMGLSAICIAEKPF